MHPRGTSFRAPVAKFFACLDLKQKSSFPNRPYLFQGVVMLKCLEIIKIPISAPEKVKHFLGGWPIEKNILIKS
jgi:hypothetical protein